MYNATSPTVVARCRRINRVVGLNHAIYRNKFNAEGGVKSKLGCARGVMPKFYCMPLQTF